VKRKTSGPETLLKRFVCLGALAISFALGGCAKIKSAIDSLVHPHRVAKNAPVSRPAHPAVPASGPRLAIILDDLGGNDSAASVEDIFALHYPLTLSVLPNHAHSAQIAAEAHRRGYQVILHLPMQAVGSEIPESNELRPGMTSPEVSKDLTGMLASVPYASGVNNHQGSRATSDAALMNELMPLLRGRNLFFIDSRTTATTVAFDTARSNGVRSAFRNVPFLDDVREVGAIRHQVSLAFKAANEKGEAIAIGHPHPETLRALAEMLPEAQADGVRLVHVSELVH
jgi:polysaccharide deacetylase 2 family uncharacterized protein YibQ